MKTIQRMSALIVAGVLLFGGVVFATPITDSFTVTTQIGEFVGVKVVPLKATEATPFDKSSFDALVTLYTEPIVVEVDEAFVGDMDKIPIAKLAYYANTKFKLSVSSTHLQGQTTTGATITYTYSVLEASNIESGVSDVTLMEPTGAITSASGGLWEIAINVNADYYSAVADDYKSTVTFTIAAT